MTIKLFILPLAFVGIFGCASVSVSKDALEARTASALGIPSGSFVISNRVDDGMRTDYTVTTSKHETYSCYVMGTITYFGKTVTDAVCNKAGKAKVSNTAKASQANCNALLSAAGKC